MQFWPSLVGVAILNLDIRTYSDILMYLDHGIALSSIAIKNP